MKLYRIDTIGIGDYWIIANDPTEAENKLKEYLGDYGYSEYRKTKVITPIAETGKQPFIIGKRLVL